MLSIIVPPLDEAAKSNRQPNGNGPIAAEAIVLAIATLRMFPRVQ